MAIIIKTELTKALTQINKVCPKNSLKPILQNCMISLDQTHIRLKATDLETGIVINVDTFSHYDNLASTLIDPRALLNTLKAIDDKEINIVIEQDNGLIIKSDSGDIAIGTDCLIKDYPAVLVGQPVLGSVNIEAQELARLFSHHVATDIESSRYALGGLMLESENDCIKAIATDGRRLHTANTVCHRNTEAGLPDGVIIPSKFCKMLLPILKKAKNDISLQVSGRADNANEQNRVRICIGGDTYETRLLAGRFPDWRQVIPSTNGHEMITIEAGKLVKATKLASTWTSNNDIGVTISIDQEAEKLTIEKGKNKITPIISRCSALRSTSVDLNPIYVNQFASLMNPDSSIELFIQDDKSAVVLSAGSNTAVVMPLAKGKKPNAK